MWWSPTRRCRARPTRYPHTIRVVIRRRTGVDAGRIVLTRRPTDVMVSRATLDSVHPHVECGDGPAHDHHHGRRRPRLSFYTNRAPVSSRSAAARRGYRHEGLLAPTYEHHDQRWVCDPRTWDHVLQERDYGYYSHENLLYTDAASTDRDVEVHVLGGLLGVAYRSGFFDLRRLVDFGAWPGGNVFVDDDWISSVLDSARVPASCWGLAGTELADQIRNQPLVAPQSELED